MSTDRLFRVRTQQPFSKNEVQIPTCSISKQQEIFENDTISVGDVCILFCHQERILHWKSFYNFLIIMKRENEHENTQHNLYML